MFGLSGVWAAVASGMSFAAAVFAAWQAVEEIPLASARWMLDPLSRGQPVEQQALKDAQSLLEQVAPIRVARDVFLGRSIVAELSYLEATDRPNLAATAAKSFRDGLARRPNAPGAWRGLLASELVSSGTIESVSGPVSGAVQLDKGDAFTSLVILEIVLRAPNAIPTELRSAALSDASKHEAYWRTRNRLARLYVSLDDTGKSTMRAYLNDPEGFDRWSRRFESR